MFHNGKQNSDKHHPIEQILIGNPRTNIRSKNYKSQTNSIIQRQRAIRSFLSRSEENEPSIRKPIMLDTTPKSLSITSISSPPSFFFADFNEPSTNNNNRQQTIIKDLDHSSPIFTRRQRPTIEHLSPLHQILDLTDLSTTQLSVAIPSNFTFRHRPSRVTLADRSSFKIDQPIPSPQINTLNYSKTISGNNLVLPKSIQQNSTHAWTSKLSEQDSRQLTSVLHRKSRLAKRFKNHPRLERMNNNPTNSDIQDLFISPRLSNNLQSGDQMKKKIRQTRLIFDECIHSKSNHDLISDKDESISTDGNSSTSTSNSQGSISRYVHSSSSQSDLFSSASSIFDHSTSKTPHISNKQTPVRRRAYHVALPTVTEYFDDELLDMKKRLEKSSTQPNDERHMFDLSIADENSLTLQILNQQETEFEKQIFKSRKFPWKKS